VNHLAIYNTKAYGDDYIALMLQGSKTIDSKFSYRKTAPYQRLQPGDVIYLKESSGPIRGRVFVTQVVHDVLETPDEVLSYLAPQYKALGIKNEAHLMKVWEAQAEKRYVCQWHMDNPQVLHEPANIIKRDMRSWVVDYDLPEHVVLAFQAQYGIASQ